MLNCLYSETCMIYLWVSILHRLVHAYGSVLHISYNMCTCDLPDMYALSPQALGVSGKSLMPMLQLLHIYHIAGNIDVEFDVLMISTPTVKLISVNMNFPDTISPWRYIILSNLNSSNAILKLIRQIYFPSIFLVIRYYSDVS